MLLQIPEEELSDIVDDTIKVDMGARFEKESVLQAIRSEIRSTIPERKSYIRRFYPYAAAVLLLGLISLAVVRFADWSGETARIDSVASADITLPDDQALVKLDDGSVFVVNDSLDRLETADIKVERVAEGVYNLEVFPQQGREEFQSFSTPKGVSNQIILADGTKIWLNSSSQILVSSNYGQGTRKVKLIGEAYFEVAKRKDLPFEVSAKETKVHVLGTMFNIRSLAQEAETRTTLTEGSVGVFHNDKSLTLRPGQQAITTGQAGIAVQEVDVDQATAWKDGYFRFDEQPLGVILNELIRWYAIEDIVWQKRVPSSISLSFGRSRSLVDILKRLEKVAGVELEIKERRIFVK